jgi:hypothetical protein
MKIKLMYITEGGSEWLNEIISVNDFNYMKSIDDYIARNQSKAEQLEDKWQSNGEDVSLILNVEPIDPISNKELSMKVLMYVENM